MLDNDVQQEFLLPTDYGANDESTLKMAVRQPSPMNPALRNQNVRENSIIELLWALVQQGVCCRISVTL